MKKYTFRHGLTVTDARDITCGISVNQPWRDKGVLIDWHGNRLHLQVVNHWPKDITAFIQAVTEANEAITETNQHLNP